MSNRRLPSPWSIEDTGAAFVVKDGSGQKLGYFYYEEKPARRSSAKLLTKDEACRFAANVAKLQELLGKPHDRRAQLSPLTVHHHEKRNRPKTGDDK